MKTEDVFQLYDELKGKHVDVFVGDNTLSGQWSSIQINDRSLKCRIVLATEDKQLVIPDYSIDSIKLNKQ